MKAILAVDQGTTSTKSLLVSRQGEILGSAAVSIGITSPQPAWVEQDAGEIWASALKSIDQVTRANPEVEVVGVAISNQRESVLAWDAVTARPVSPVISWQDQRGEMYREQYSSPETVALVADKTGLEFSAMYSALKLRWLCQNVDLNNAHIGTVDAWLVASLTAEPSAVEAGNASRTMLFNIESLNWDAELIELFGIQADALPPVVASDAHRGGTKSIAGVPDGTPVLAVLGDSHAALFGHWALAPQFGQAGKVTYGTGSSIMIPAQGATDRRSGVATTLGWVIDDQPLWAFEGNILYSGAGMDFLAGVLGVAGGRGLSQLAAEAEDSGGVSFVPALNGLGAPWWTPDAVGTLTGMSAATQRSQIARAGIESVANQVADVVEVMTAGDSPEALHAGGGATASRLLMQTQADLLGCQMVVSAAVDVSAVGAAALGWQQLGKPLRPIEAQYELNTPTQDAETKRTGARQQWHQALARAGVSTTNKASTREK